jgi:hypothetical protein
MSRWNWSKRWQIPFAATGIICLAAGPDPGSTSNGIYTGKRVLTKGPTPLCPAEDNVSVTIRDGTLSFTNSELRNFVMGFHPDPDGSFVLTYVDRGGATVAIQGRITGASMDADVVNYATACEHHWRLRKELQHP